MLPEHLQVLARLKSCTPAHTRERALSLMIEFKWFWNETNKVSWYFSFFYLVCQKAQPQLLSFYRSPVSFCMIILIWFLHYNLRKMHILKLVTFPKLCFILLWLLGLLSWENLSPVSEWQDIILLYWVGEKKMVYLIYLKSVEYNSDYTIYSKLFYRTHTGGAAFGTVKHINS